MGAWKLTPAEELKTVLETAYPNSKFRLGATKEKLLHIAPLEHQFEDGIKEAPAELSLEEVLDQVKPEKFPDGVNVWIGPPEPKLQRDSDVLEIAIDTDDESPDDSAEVPENKPDFPVAPPPTKKDPETSVKITKEDIDESIPERPIPTKSEFLKVEDENEFLIAENKRVMNINNGLESAVERLQQERDGLELKAASLEGKVQALNDQVNTLAEYLQAIYSDMGMDESILPETLQERVEMIVDTLMSKLQDNNS